VESQQNQDLLILKKLETSKIGADDAAQLR
jgi:hypothetical protein